MSCELDCWKEYQTPTREKLAKSNDGNDTTAVVTTPVLSATSGTAEFFDLTAFAVDVTRRRNVYLEFRNLRST